MLILALSLALAQASGPIAEATVNYDGCLRKTTIDMLGRQVAPAEFDAKIRPACEEWGFILERALYTDGRARGLARDPAKAAAEAKIQEHLGKAKSEYRVHAENGTTPE